MTKWRSREKGEQGTSATLALTLLVAVAVALLSTPAALSGQGGNEAEVLLQEALHVELSEGDLERAIELYRSIVDHHYGNREVAAKALVRVGGCFEKLGMEAPRHGALSRA